MVIDQALPIIGFKPTIGLITSPDFKKLDTPSFGKVIIVIICSL